MKKQTNEIIKKAGALIVPLRPTVKAAIKSTKEVAMLRPLPNINYFTIA